ncbi:MAG: hypothetical protein DMG21_22505, partial [Acidobacteria bacterium]
MEASRSGIFPRNGTGALLRKGAFGALMLSLLVGPEAPVRRLTGRAVPAPSPAENNSRDKVLGLYARQPLRFEENVGQTDGQVDFLARGLGYTVFLTRQGAVLSLAENQKSEIRNQKQ